MAMMLFDRHVEISPRDVLILPKDEQTAVLKVTSVDPSGYVALKVKTNDPYGLSVKPATKTLEGGETVNISILKRPGCKPLSGLMVQAVALNSNKVLSSEDWKRLLGIQRLHLDVRVEDFSTCPTGLETVILADRAPSEQEPEVLKITNGTEEEAPGVGEENKGGLLVQAVELDSDSVIGSEDCANLSPLDIQRQDLNVSIDSISTSAPSEQEPEVRAAETEKEAPGVGEHNKGDLLVQAVELDKTRVIGSEDCANLSPLDIQRQDLNVSVGDISTGAPSEQEPEVRAAGTQKEAPGVGEHNKGDLLVQAVELDSDRVIGSEDCANLNLSPLDTVGAATKKEVVGVGEENKKGWKMIDGNVVLALLIFTPIYLCGVCMRALSIFMKCCRLLYRGVRLLPGVIRYGKYGYGGCIRVLCFSMQCCNLFRIGICYTASGMSSLLRRRMKTPPTTGKVQVPAVDSGNDDVMDISGPELLQVPAVDSGDEETPAAEVPKAATSKVEAPPREEANKIEPVAEPVAKEEEEEEAVKPPEAAPPAAEAPKEQAPTAEAKAPSKEAATEEPAAEAPQEEAAAALAEAAKAPSKEAPKEAEEEAPATKETPKEEEEAPATTLTGDSSCGSSNGYYYPYWSE